MTGGDRADLAAGIVAGYGPAGSLVVRLAARLWPIFETETQRRAALAGATADFPDLAADVAWGGPALDFARSIAGWLLTRKGTHGRQVLVALLDEAARRVSEVDPENADFAVLRAEVEAFRPPVLAVHGDAPDRPLPEAFAALQAAIAGDAPAAALSRATLDAVIRHRPASLTEYRLSRVAEWSQAGYELDRRFTRLTLMIDQGPATTGQRWSERPDASFDDLRDVLGAVRDRAVVVLGEPGAGKSTLLRRLELDLAVDALTAPRAGTGDGAGAAGADAGADDGRVTFFVDLSRYAPVITNDGLRKRAEPSADAWLAEQWRQRCPELPGWGDMLATGRVVVLLDALNEMPHAGEADFDDRREAWREWLRDLPPGNRAVFTCRSLDYSAGLSTDKLPVPQARVERMDDGQVRRFLQAYLPDRWAEVLEQIDGTDLLDIVKTPFYAGLLVQQADAEGALPRGRAGLVTGFVRHALRREVGNRHTLFLMDAGLLTPADHAQIQQRRDNVYALPSGGPLIPKIVDLAFAMQAGGRGQDVVREVVTRADACALVDHPRADDIVDAGVALGILVVKTREELDATVAEVEFFHQLFREYFAARNVARNLDPARMATEWRAEAMPERLDATLARIAPADPLPPAPATGWEEPAALAAAMTPRPDDFVQAVAAVNLPLAGRCAAEADVRVSEAVKADLRQRLVARTGDAAADLRARIAAGLALGRLGDPRFERREGPHGPYIVPPMVCVPAGRYPIGTERGGWPDERPAHYVELPEFHLGQFPVTNAEWALFVASGGYADEQWWETEAARAWLRGDPASVEHSRQWQRDFWRSGPKDDASFQTWVADRPGLTDVDIPWLQWFFGQSAEELESTIAGWYPAERKSEPQLWNDAAFNASSQPVVGVCWFEARAYCAWLRAQSGQAFCLPSEVEWEAAARGPKGRVFAYGDTFDAAVCNTFETHVRRTTPVGVFPGGVTLGSDGLHDMTGNVWEWTRSLWGAESSTPEHGYPYDLADSRRENPNADPKIRRVVRGGSWGFPSLGARAASRYRLIPDDRNLNVGVRLAVSALISVKH